MREIFFKKKKKNPAHIMVCLDDGFYLPCCLIQQLINQCLLNMWGGITALHFGVSVHNHKGGVSVQCLFDSMSLELQNSLWPDASIFCSCCAYLAKLHQAQKPSCNLLSIQYATWYMQLGYTSW